MAFKYRSQQNSLQKLELDEKDALRNEVIKDFSDEIINLYSELRDEMTSFGEMGIDF